ncbi:hypothetical protein V1294_005871 [Bradyrhizobium sp. AZCC 1678]|uniref:hypothetical protein n=1 Tax=Bradyrhizobium sp. AZCC 1678 TaxID=3117030 RepID=UPI002FF350A0
MAIVARLEQASFTAASSSFKANPSVNAKPTIKAAMKICSILPRSLIRRSCMGFWIRPTAGKFDSLKILNEIPMPADHSRSFLLPRLVQGGQQPCPDSDAQRRSWMAFG